MNRRYSCLFVAGCPFDTQPRTVYCSIHAEKFLEMVRDKDTKPPINIHVKSTGLQDKYAQALRLLKRLHQRQSEKVWLLDAEFPITGRPFCPIVVQFTVRDLSDGNIIIHVPKVDYGISSSDLIDLACGTMNLGASVRTRLQGTVNRIYNQEGDAMKLSDARTKILQAGYDPRNTNVFGYGTSSDGAIFLRILAGGDRPLAYRIAIKPYKTVQPFDIRCLAKSMMRGCPEGFSFNLVHVHQAICKCGQPFRPHFRTRTRKCSSTSQNPLPNASVNPYDIPKGPSDSSSNGPA
ncbi:hypothetical protein HDK90DRAFT_117495 [Phyllosticta capitalensis]|uniref:Uncharacterized protein n=2 Tax=Phyllosticta capitalensis TaxID=121624 RepID=A0ABR1YAN8_9PEZI